MGSELSNSLNWTKRLHWEYMMQNLGHQDWCSGLVMAVPECHSLADFSWTGSCFTCLTLRLALVGGEFKQHWFKPCRSSMFQGLQSFWKVQIIGLYPDLCDSDPQNPCGHDKTCVFSKLPGWFQWYSKKEDAQMGPPAFMDPGSMARRPFSKSVCSFYVPPFSITLKKIVFISNFSNVDLL